MTLNCIQWCSFSSGERGVTFSLQLLPGPLLSEVIVLVKVSSMFQIDVWKLFVLRKVTWSYNCLFRFFIIIVIHITSNHLVWFYGISTIVGSSTPSPDYITVFEGIWRCPWCNGYHCRKWTWRHEFKSSTRLITFHIALIPLGKVWIQ